MIQEQAPPPLDPAVADSLAVATVLVTGAAGFIGFAVARRLAAAGVRVVGVDDLSALYYPVQLKHMRLAELERHESFHFARADIADLGALSEVFGRAEPTHVVHLAAHAAVMPSFEAPLDYLRSNVTGTQCVLEAVRAQDGIRHLVYASTSSVYGRAKQQRPFSEDQKTDTPVSVYGASKVANEAMMQAYADRYGLPVTGLRFFKVYGPWGRPDTVFFKFVERIHKGLPIKLHNHGDITHAFTYIDDIVDGVMAALAHAPRIPPGAAHPVYNLGNPNSQKLGHCVDLIEAALGRPADRLLVDLPPGDRVFSIADIARARADLGYDVRIPVEVGIPRLVEWYLEAAAEIDGPAASDKTP